LPPGTYARQRRLPVEIVVDDKGAILAFNSLVNSVTWRAAVASTEVSFDKLEIASVKMTLAG
jgi:hypothetical protein